MLSHGRLVERRGAVDPELRVLEPRPGELDPVALDPAVPEVLDVARVDLEPPHLLRGAVPGHHADARAVVGPPLHHRAVAEVGDVDHDRGVEEHGVVLGDDEVVHHHRRGDLDLGAVHERSGGVDDVVPDDRFEHRVGEEEHLAGARIEAGMGGHRPGEAAVEVVLADGLERRRDLGGQPAFPQRQVPAGVADDVGVRRVLHRARVAHQRRVGEAHDVAEARVHRSAELDLGAQALGPDPAVAVRRPRRRRRT